MLCKELNGFSSQRASSSTWSQLCLGPLGSSWHSHSVIHSHRPWWHWGPQVFPLGGWGLTDTLSVGVHSAKKKKTTHKLMLQPLFFFYIQFFQHSLKAAGIMRNKYVLFQMWCRLYWTTLWKKGLQRFICGSRSSTISVCLNSSCDWNHPDCYHLCCSPLYYKVSISGILQ